jgi:hypothetical protein
VSTSSSITRGGSAWWTPPARAVLISVGAALLNLRIAVLAHGRTPLTRLMPDGDQSDHIAHVTFGRPVHVSQTVRMLAQAIPRRRTNRRPFSNASIPKEVLAELVDAAAVERGRLAVADPPPAMPCWASSAWPNGTPAARPPTGSNWAGGPGQWPHRRDGIPPQTYGPWSALETMPIPTSV